MSRTDRASSSRSRDGWTSDPADRKKWTLKLREGVKFHADRVRRQPVVWNFDEWSSIPGPAFAQRNPLKCAPACLGASWKKIDATTVEVMTKTVDSLFPSSSSGSDLQPRNMRSSPRRQNIRFEPSGRRPSRLAKLTPREQCELREERGLRDKSRCRRSTSDPDLHPRKPSRARPPYSPVQPTSSRRLRLTPFQKSRRPASS